MNPERIICTQQSSFSRSNCLRRSRRLCCRLPDWRDSSIKRTSRKPSYEFVGGVPRNRFLFSRVLFFLRADSNAEARKGHRKATQQRNPLRSFAETSAPFAVNQSID